jgi:Phosphotransferase enzyme family
MSVINFQDIEDRVKTWFTVRHPNLHLESLNLCNGGTVGMCFQVNHNLILKIYIPKNGIFTNNEHNYFNQGSYFQNKLTHLNFIPKVYGIYENDDILQANAILMDCVNGEALSEILYYQSIENQLLIGNKIGQALKEMHDYEVCKNQIFDITNIWNNAKIHLESIQDRNVLDGNDDYNLVNFASSYIKNYKPKKIFCDFVHTHNDLHIANILVTKNKDIVLIDFDKTSQTPAFFELKKILISLFIPAFFVDLHERDKYKDKYFISVIKGIIIQYPEICQKRYLDIIKLMILGELLLSYPQQDCHDRLGILSNHKRMFKLIFIDNILEKILKV